MGKNSEHSIPTVRLKTEIKKKGKKTRDEGEQVQECIFEKWTLHEGPLKTKTIRGKRVKKATVGLVVRKAKGKKGKTHSKRKIVPLCREGRTHRGMTWREKRKKKALPANRHRAEELVGRQTEEKGKENDFEGQGIQKGAEGTLK